MEKNIFLHQKKGRTMKKIFPPSYFFASMIISVLLHFLVPVIQIINQPITLSGWIFIIAGSGLNIWADQLFNKHKTTVKPDEKPIKLIDYGPFSFTKNPMCLGMAAILLGIGIILGSLTSFVGLLIFIAVMRFQYIPSEEKILIETFGKEYEVYKTNVRRWI
jgi:protein-S-isoprenylcysteine O-methyltransferase Ste14